MTEVSAHIVASVSTTLVGSYAMVWHLLLVHVHPVPTLVVVQSKGVTVVPGLGVVG